MHEAALDGLTVLKVVMVTENRGGNILKLLGILVEGLHLEVAMGHSKGGLLNWVGRGVVDGNRHCVVRLFGIVGNWAVQISRVGFGTKLPLGRCDHASLLFDVLLNKFAIFLVVDLHSLGQSIGIVISNMLLGCA